MTSCVTLYYTDGCHLCDDAMVLLRQAQLTVNKVDIIEHQHLVELYGTLIPVVEKAKDKTLNWPFSAPQLQDFIEEN